MKFLRTRAAEGEIVNVASLTGLESERAIMPAVEVPAIMLKRSFNKILPSGSQLLPCLFV